MSTVSVRPATSTEHAAVAAVLDAAMLETDDLQVAIEESRVLAAVADDRVLGVLLYTTPPAPERESERAHVDAIAVRRRRRGQGIGTRLIRELLSRFPVVTTDFDAEVRPFYESLEFSITPLDDGRFRGIIRREDA